ncbi:helix-turn-helix transcriptional regulator [Sporosarcina sp. Te-1]|uniref:helix-turn-helix transcriptional regulator n=1 Tax=Sporosarcina sp. Te-1 TaxID=2818390 RepID=UPI001A9FF412|nr:helix-turn-helix transcriptional regulator [Sporosarcina sp. Te-1]QTD41946.1 helix-turn-helix transcriptional regulator [Sporosarcina sp. Te-1]
MGIEKLTKSSIVNFELIRKTRIKKGISTEEMSSLLGYEAPNAYFRKEKGDRRFSVKDIVKISGLLGIPIQKLFFTI